MPGITLKDSTSFAAEFRVLQGSDQVARLGVAPTGKAVIPTGNNYSVQAETNLGKFTLYSNVITFEAPAAYFLAQVMMDDPGLRLPDRPPAGLAAEPDRAREHVACARSCSGSGRTAARSPRSRW